MNYNDFKGDIKELINLKLDEIEKKENVKILHAIESGSRAWGFESPDSDYDVRFIYVHPKEYYLELDKKKDTISWELNETLDINGWDLKKALVLFRKSNTTLFEWANSPVVYRTTDNWKEIYKEAEKYFSIKSSMYQYYGTANSNYHEYLKEEYVKYKKYFYVIRPILACKWIEKKMCPPPVLFNDLMESMLDDEMKKLIADLLEAKKKMKESDKGKAIKEINDYIETNLVYYKDFIGKYEENRDLSWKGLNDIFIKQLDV